MRRSMSAVFLFLAIALLAGQLHAQGNNINIRELVPENGGTVVGLPATFICDVTVSLDNVQATIDWYINDQRTDTNFVTEDIGADLIQSSLFRENLTIIRFFPVIELPPSLDIACSTRDIPPGNFFGNFTLLTVEPPTTEPPTPVPPTTMATTSLPPPTVPPPVVTVSFRQNVTVTEGEVALLCVDAFFDVDQDPPAEFVDVDLNVLSQSTAEPGSDYVSTIPSSVRFMASQDFSPQCFGIPIIADSDTTEINEVISIELMSDSPFVEINQFARLATVTITCRDGDIRLIGGLDEFQGRVEICYNQVWSTVCDDAWGNDDAAVVCRQLGFTGGPVAYVNNGGRAPFGEGFGVILLDDVACSGSENFLVNCSHNGFGSHNCGHQEDAGVDCLGRPQPPPPAIGFESGLPGAVAEGDSVELCVVVSTGTISQTSEIFISSGGQFKRQGPINEGSATPGVDFTTIPEYDTERFRLTLVFSPGDTRQCFIVNATDDPPQQLPNVDRRLVQFSLNTGESNVAVTGIQVHTLFILDNDRNCTNGSSICVDVPNRQVSCTPASDICNGINNCPDGSDEENCERICPPNLYECLSENKCLPLSYQCDSYPDCLVPRTDLDGQVAGQEENNAQCTTGCVNGEVQLVGGLTPTEGMVSVCFNGLFLPVTMEMFSIVEASVICQQLGHGEAGYPVVGIDLLLFQLLSPVPSLVSISCPPSATSLSQCTLSIPDSAVDFRQAAVVCQSTKVNCNDGNIRISPDGPSEFEGRLEICYQGVWGAVFDPAWTSADAAVACRELGYQSQGAVPFSGAVYSNELFPFVSEYINCQGNETRISDCRAGITPISLGRPMTAITMSRSNYLFSVAGVRCEEYLSDGCSELDVRLTYRDASGQSGQFEICKDSTWRTTCGPTIFSNQDAMVACNQFFNTSERERQPTYFSLATVLSETSTQFTTPLMCMGFEGEISECMGFNLPNNETRIKRIVSEPSECARDNQPTVRCIGSPVVRVAPDLPDRIFKVESGRSALIQCRTESNTIPQPFIVTVNPPPSVPGGNGLKRGVDVDYSPQNVLPSGRPLTPLDGGDYTCRSMANLRETRERVSVQVLEPEGLPELGYVQFSFPTTQRLQLITQDSSFASEAAFTEGAGQFLFNLIGERTPGIQTVSCAVIENRAIDIERGLTRVECTISHFTRSDETETTTANEIAERLVSIVPRTVAFITDVEAVVPPSVAFSMPESDVAEGNTVSVCLNVVSGVIQESTTIRLTLTPQIVIIDVGGIPPGGIPPGDSDEGGEPLPILNQFPYAIPNIHYTTNPPIINVSTSLFAVDLILEPGQTETCLNVITIENNETAGSDITQVSLSFLSSTPTVSQNDLFHDVYIFDNDRNCTAEIALGSRLCLNFPARTVSCLNTSLVCDYVTADCPDESDEINCPSPLEDIVNEVLTEETYGNTTELVSMFAALSANSTFLQTPVFLADVSKVFGNIADLVNSSNITINSTVVGGMVNTLNSLLQWQPQRLVVDSTSNAVQAFEQVASQFAQQDSFNVTLSDITFVAELSTTETFQATGSSQDFSGQVGVPASISLPSTLFNQVPEDRTVIGVFFALYEVPVLFPPNNTLSENNRTVSVGSPIVAATVGPGIDFVNIDPPIVISLGLFELPENFTSRPGSEQCVSWDFASDSWVTTGCTTIRVSDSVVNCECNHLTNFAVLIDICSRAQDCVSDPVADSILSVITYIGVVISCIGLIITVVTLLAFKKLRERDNSKYHIQLSIAIFCMLVVFAAGIEQTQVYAGCVIVSILIHYFSLVAVMWMGAEALLMFQKLVIVFMRITTKFLVVLSLTCWLVPLIPVLIPMIIDLADGTSPSNDLIITRNVDNTTGEVSGFCFHKHPGVFFGAFLAPIFAIIIFNLVIFIWVIVILIKHTKGQLDRSKEGIKPATVIRLIISISGVMFLFGLTWLFAAFTFSIAGNNTVRIIFQALFVVFASFQGFFIFLFFCVFNKEARESWRELLSCGRYKSEFLHPSQYKNTSTATGTRHNKARTGTTAVSSSVGGATYNSATLDKSTFESEASPLPEKKDLGKEDEARYTEIPLKSTNEEPGEGTTTFKDIPEVVVVETHIDEEEIDSKEAEKWSRAEGEPILKARVKRYSTKKVSKHHVEEFEIDFNSEESAEEA